MVNKELFNDYVFVLSTINNKDNKEHHYDAIENLVNNFRNKWSKDKGRSFKILKSMLERRKNGI